MGQAGHFVLSPYKCLQIPFITQKSIYYAKVHFCTSSNNPSQLASQPDIALSKPLPLRPQNFRQPAASQLPASCQPTVKKIAGKRRTFEITTIPPKPPQPFR